MLYAVLYIGAETTVKPVKKQAVKPFRLTNYWQLSANLVTTAGVTLRNFYS